MNEKVDLTKILKNCPKGFKLYSPMVGEVEFERILDDSAYPIVTLYNRLVLFFTSEGLYYDNAGEEAECLLFLSKDQRDWSKFTAPWYKKEKFDQKTLKPFDKVLVRDSSDRRWRCAIFSHVRKEDENYTFKYVTTACTYEFCIPYNEDTKHLVGTNEEAPKYYRYWEY